MTENPQNWKLYTTKFFSKELSTPTWTILVTLILNPFMFKRVIMWWKFFRAKRTAFLRFPHASKIYYIDSLVFTCFSWKPTNKCCLHKHFGSSPTRNLISSSPISEFLYWVTICSNINCLSETTTVPNKGP